MYIASNLTSLSYEELGHIIDHIINTSDPGKTYYVGKVENGIAEYKGKKILISIKYLKKYTKWEFEEVE